MNIKVDDVIELEKTTKYAILLESETTEERYFLAVLLDKNEEPTKSYVVLKEIASDDEIYVQKVNDLEILNQLIGDYTNQYNDLYS